METAITYAPVLYFDKHEPFFPHFVGVSYLKDGDDSPSFRRSFCFNGEIKMVIEYAIYWDFDIEHMYDLEHIWVYVNHHGTVVHCEASFHGKYFVGLLKDKSNIENDNHVKLYSQPGKHAFLPRDDMFFLLPHLHTCTKDGAGKGGLLITSIFQGIIEKEIETDTLVQKYMKRFAFQPSLQFKRYEIPVEIIHPWESVKAQIPARIRQKLMEMKGEIG
ncbi:NPP1 family protein [Alkalihalobacterium bogoriense]|uniref:NPP1 family protein n=1 Tax=Alkalihalobacterium bogoriense TaxID=246272 RepID=UPI001C5838B9|nr:NPP1 family protein [Alkalihalobacterium bogoriense]